MASAPLTMSAMQLYNTPAPVKSIRRRRRTSSTSATCPKICFQSSPIIPRLRPGSRGLRSTPAVHGRCFASLRSLLPPPILNFSSSVVLGSDIHHPEGFEGGCSKLYLQPRHLQHGRGSRHPVRACPLQIPKSADGWGACAHRRAGSSYRCRRQTKAGGSAGGSSSTGRPRRIVIFVCGLLVYPPISQTFIDSSPRMPRF